MFPLMWNPATGYLLQLVAAEHFVKKHSRRAASPNPASIRSCCDPPQEL